MGDCNAVMRTADQSWCVPRNARPRPCSLDAGQLRRRGVPL